jgi:hypothetical protein
LSGFQPCPWAVPTPWLSDLYMEGKASGLEIRGGGCCAVTRGSWPAALSSGTCSWAGWPCRSPAPPARCGLTHGEEGYACGEPRWLHMSHSRESPPSLHMVARAASNPSSPRPVGRDPGRLADAGVPRRVDRASRISRLRDAPEAAFRWAQPLLAAGAQVGVTHDLRAIVHSYCLWAAVWASLAGAARGPWTPFAWFVG